MFEAIAGILALVLLGVVIFALGLRKRLREVTEKYAPVIDAEKEREEILAQASVIKRGAESDASRVREEAEGHRQDVLKQVEAEKLAARAEIARQLSGVEGRKQEIVDEAAALKHQAAVDASRVHEAAEGYRLSVTKQADADKLAAYAEIARKLGEVESTKSAVLADIGRLRSEKAAFDQEYASSKAGLKAKFQEARSRYEKLMREVNTLEETLEMIEFGVYKPHFDYGSPDKYRAALEALRAKEKALIKDERAVTCRTEWSVGGSKAEGQKMTKQTHKLMLRAFNGECDAALAKVRWDNILKMEERVSRAAEAINKAAEVNQSFVTPEYINLKTQELRLTYELQEKIKEEKDEQRRIQEEIGMCQ